MQTKFRRLFKNNLIFTAISFILVIFHLNAWSLIPLLLVILPYFLIFFYYLRKNPQTKKENNLALLSLLTLFFTGLCLVIIQISFSKSGLFIQLVILGILLAAFLSSFYSLHYIKKYLV